MYELHGDVPVVVDFTDFVNADDVRVFEAKGDVAFVFKHRDEALIFRIGRQDSLDGDIKLRSGLIFISSFINLGHAAYSDLTVEKEFAKRFGLSHVLFLSFFTRMLFYEFDYNLLHEV